MGLELNNFDYHKQAGIKGQSADASIQNLDAQEASIHTQVADNQEKITTNEAERNDLETQKEEQETTVEENIETLSQELDDMTQSLSTMDQAVQQANQAATAQETAAQTLYNTANSMPDMIPDPNANPKEGESVPMIPNPEKKEMLQQADAAKKEAEEARRAADELAQQEQELVKSCEELTAEIDSIEQGESSEEGESVEETDEELDANEDEYQDLQDKNDELERLLTDIQTRKQQEETKETPTYDEGIDRSVFEEGYESTEQGEVDNNGNVTYNGVTYTKNADGTYNYPNGNCNVTINPDGTKTVTANGKVITYGNGTTTISDENATYSPENGMDYVSINYNTNEDGSISSVAGISSKENGKTTETAFNEDGTKTTTVKDKNGNTIYEQNTNENNQTDGFKVTKEDGSVVSYDDIEDSKSLKNSSQYDRESGDRDAIKSHDGLSNVENGLENEQYHGTQLDLDKYYDKYHQDYGEMFGEQYSEYIDKVGKEIEKDIAANFGVDLTSENSTADMANIYREIYKNNEESFKAYFQDEYFTQNYGDTIDPNNLDTLDDAQYIDMMNNAMAYFSWDAAGLDNDYLNLTGIGYNTESSDNYALGNPDEYFGVRNESDGTFTIAGQEGLVANHDVDLDDLRNAKEGEYTLIKDGKEVTLSITGENEGEKIYTLTEKDENNYQTTIKYDSKTNEQAINVSYNAPGYTPEEVSSYSVKYNEAGEYTEYENKVIDPQTGMWNVESSDGNYAYNKDIETGEYTYYPVDAEGNVITKYEKSNDDITKDYSYTDKNLAIQAGNIINSGKQPMTQAEIDEAVDKLASTNDLTSINEILNDIDDGNLAGVLYEYNNQNQSKTFIQKVDEKIIELDGERDEIMGLVANKLSEEVKSGNHLATKVLAQELNKNTAGKLGTADEFVKHFVEDNYNEENYEVLSDVTKEYYREFGGRLRDAIYNDMVYSGGNELVEKLENAFETTNGMGYQEWFNKETKGYTDEELAEIRIQAQNTTSYVTNTFNAEAYEKDSANANNTTNTTNTTSGKSTTVADLDKNMDMEAGQKLADVGVVGKGGNAGGWCLREVDNTLDKIYGSHQRYGHAYQSVEEFRNKNGLGQYFGELENVSREDLPNLPAGCVVVWDQDSVNTSGHISICLGDGREVSDFIGNQIIRDVDFHVFYPQKA